MATHTDQKGQTGEQEEDGGDEDVLGMLSLPRIGKMLERACQVGVSKSKASLSMPCIVSVGSGRGVHEAWLSSWGEMLPTCEWICIDPDPSSWVTTQYGGRKEMLPHYATVYDLMLTRPEVVGACVLLLIWPYPTDDDFPEAGYDHEAIQALNPIGVVGVTAATQQSGSTRLHEWLTCIFNMAVKPTETMVKLKDKEFVKQAVDFRPLDRHRDSVSGIECWCVARPEKPNVALKAVSKPSRVQS